MSKLLLLILTFNLKLTCVVNINIILKKYLKVRKRLDEIIRKDQVLYELIQKIMLKKINKNPDIGGVHLTKNIMKC